MYFIEGGLISFVLAHLVDTTHAVCVLLARELSWPLHESFIGLSKPIFFKFGIIWRDVEGTIFFPLRLVNKHLLTPLWAGLQDSEHPGLFVCSHFLHSTCLSYSTHQIHIAGWKKMSLLFTFSWFIYFFSNLMNENKCHNLHYCMFRNRFNEVGGSLNEAVWSQEAMAHADL